MFTHPEDMLSTPSHTWHGSAVMWHESLESNILSLKTENERFTGVKIKFQTQHYLAISVYYPTSGKDCEFLECISNLSDFINKHNEENQTILIGADSNCSEKSSPRRKEAFRKFCEEFDLHKSHCNGPTFHHHNGSSSSNIDYFLVSAKSSAQLKSLSAICTLENPENFSSHDPVTAILMVQSENSEHVSDLYSHTYSDFSQKKIIWDQDKLQEYQSIAAKALSDCESYFPSAEFIPLKCQLYSDLFVKSAELTQDSKLPAKTFKNVKPSGRKPQAWQYLRKTLSTWKNIGGKSKQASYFSNTNMLGAISSASGDMRTISRV